MAFGETSPVNGKGPVKKNVFDTIRETLTGEGTWYVERNGFKPEDGAPAPEDDPNNYRYMTRRGVRYQLIERECKDCGKTFLMFTPKPSLFGYISFIGVCPYCGKKQKQRDKRPFIVIGIMFLIMLGFIAFAVISSHAMMNRM